MSKHVKEWAGRAAAEEKIAQLADHDLADALLVALDHRALINYDSLAAVYDAADDSTRQLMEEVGVVIVLRQAPR